MNVYDFDNTIYDGETLVDFILYYVKTDPKIWRYVPKLIRIYFKDVCGLFTIAEAVKAYAAFLEGYYIQKAHSLDGDVQKFWDRNEHKIKSFYQEVRRDDDVIVSGSTDFLLDEICKRLGIRHYIGSSIDKQTGKFTRLCFLENKVEIFKSLYPAAEIENFYTDSMNDKPMMEISQHVFFVKGDRITQIK